MKVELAPKALAELIDQMEWLLPRSPEAADKAAEQIEQALLLLAEFPASAPLKANGYREAMVKFGRYGFVVRYQLTNDTVYVVRFFHGRQNRAD